MSDQLAEIRRAIILSLIRSSKDQLEGMIGDLEDLQRQGHERIPLDVDGDAYGLSVSDTIKVCRMLLSRQPVVSVRVGIG